MYDDHPMHKNSTAGKVVTGLFAMAAAAFAGSALTPAYPAVLQAIGICLFVPMIQISVRFLLTRYLYRLKEREDGGLDLEIYTYRGGANMQLVCRIGLEEITAAEPLCKENRKPPQKIRRYHYAPDMAPREGLVLSVTNRDGDCQILLSPDEYLAKVFRNAADEASRKQP